MKTKQNSIQSLPKTFGKFISKPQLRALIKRATGLREVGRPEFGRPLTAGESVEVIGRAVIHRYTVRIRFNDGSVEPRIRREDLILID